MNWLNIASVVCALAGLVVGLFAAGYWLKASRVEIDPGWSCEPGDSQESQRYWVTATMKAVQESSDLNKTAAWLTAVAVVLSAVSSVLGVLASCLSAHF